MLRAEVLQRLGRNDEARAEVERALHLAPDVPGVVLPAAMLRESQGDTAGAEALLARAAARHPDDQDVQWFLGLARLGQDDLAAAEETFARLVDEADRVPSDYAVAARVALAVARGVDDPSRGVPPFVEAVEQDPGLAVSAARTLALSGRSEPVLRIAESAAAGSPDDPEVGFAHASILQGTGASDQAVAVAERLLATLPEVDGAGEDAGGMDGPSTVDLQVGLRLVAAAADAERLRFGAARERLREALDLQPGHPQAMQLLVRAVLEGRGSKEDVADLRRRIAAAREANPSPSFRALLDQLDEGLSGS